MALTYKMLSELSDMARSDIDSTTRITTITGTNKLNKNLLISDLIDSSLSSSNTYTALSSSAGKYLNDNKANKSGDTFTGPVIINIDPTDNGFSVTDNEDSFDYIKIDSALKKLLLGGYVSISGISEFADNSSALTAGLALNRIYRTGDTLKIVH